MSEDRPEHRVAVAAITVDTDGRVLLLKRRDHGHWEPPGGVLEHGEGVLDALAREVEEETGVQIVPGALTGVYKNTAEPVVALVFRSRPSGGRLRVSDEAAEVRWIAPGAAQEMLGDEYRTWIDDALKDSGVQVRTQDRFEMGT